MKQVLILAYDFPPYISVGGLRPLGWYNYFKEYGLYPIIVTRQWGNNYGNSLDYVVSSESNEILIEQTDKGVIIRTPYIPNLANKILIKYGENKFKTVRKLITAYYEFSQFIFINGTKSELYKAAEKYIIDNKIDYIIATGSPHILFKYASKLSSKYNIKWIADYRDPWTQSRSRSKNLFLRYWNHYFEKKFTKNTSLISTVSEFTKKKISELIKKEIILVPNGYDANFLDDVSKIDQNNEELNFAYIGTIYGWHSYKSVLKTIDKFICEGGTAYLNFYGINKEDEVKVFVQKECVHLANKVRFFNKTTNRELFKSLAENNVFLLFNDYNLIGTKIFDYIAINRKILLCYSEEKSEKYKSYPYYNDKSALMFEKEQEVLIDKLRAGDVVKDSEQLFEELKKIEKEFNKYRRVEQSLNNIEIYSRRNSVKKLAERILQL